MGVNRNPVPDRLCGLKRGACYIRLVGRRRAAIDRRLRILVVLEGCRAKHGPVTYPLQLGMLRAGPGLVTTLGCDPLPHGPLWSVT